MRLAKLKNLLGLLHKKVLSFASLVVGSRTFVQGEVVHTTFERVHFGSVV